MSELLDRIASAQREAGERVVMDDLRERGLLDVVMSAHEPPRIDQTVFGAKGNCQSACLAMLLGLRLEDVPNFNEFADYNGAMYGFLEQRGYTILTFPISAVELRAFQKGYAIVGGMSPRGINHAVLYKDGELWHDPHPERGGVHVSAMDVVYPLRPFASPLPTPRESQP